jgi:hypothetical protein
MRLSFTESIRFMAPEGLGSALPTAAASQYCSMSEYIRRSLIRSLQESGIPIERPQAASRHEGGRGPWAKGRGS